MSTLNFWLRVLQVVAIAGLLSMNSARAQADLRVALVIGNAAYAAAPLANPSNDAKAVAEVLKGHGFKVLTLNDASKEQMEASIAAAREALAGRNGIGLLYYAGHGIQLDWRNYLIPVDAAIKAAADVPRQAIDVQQVIEAFKAAGTRINIVVLDACRDNPFGATGSGKGLAQMDAPAGTFLAYATAPGNVAEDGTVQSGNGLYTQYLIKELAQRDARIEEVFKRVRYQVRRATQGRQIPWESTSLDEDFVFSTGQKVESATSRQREAEFDAEIADWNRIKTSSDADALYAFLQKYPDGRLSELVRFRLERVQASRVEPAAAPDGSMWPPSAAPRWALGDEFVWHVLDGYTSNLSRVITQRVTAVRGERVEFNGGQSVFEQVGAIVRARGMDYETPQFLLPADLAIGKRWRTAFKGRDGPISFASYLDVRVVALEDVAVPAGKVRAFKIEASGETQSPGATTQFDKVTYWVDPSTMLPVRWDFDFRRDGRRTVFESMVLVRTTKGSAK